MAASPFLQNHWNIPRLSTALYRQTDSCYLSLLDINIMTLKCGPLKHEEPLSSGHSVTSHKTSGFDNTAVRAPNLAKYV
jgi:hypothetical protein